MPPETKTQNQIPNTAFRKNILITIALVLGFGTLMILAFASLDSNIVHDQTLPNKITPTISPVNGTPKITEKPSITATPNPSVADFSGGVEEAVPYQKCTTFKNSYVSFTCPQDGYAYVKTFSSDSLAQGVLEINLATDSYQIRIQPFQGGTEGFTYNKNTPLLIPSYGAGEGELRLKSAPKPYTLDNGLKVLYFGKDLNDAPGLYFSYKSEGANEFYIIDKNLVFGLDQLNGLLEWQGTYQGFENKPSSVAVLIDTKDKMTLELADRIMSDLDNFFKNFRLL